MKPDFEVVSHSPGVQWQAISEPGKQYAIVFTGTESNWVKLNLPKGKYNYQFVSPFSGKKLKSGFFTKAEKADHQLSFPSFTDLIALKITRR